MTSRYFHWFILAGAAILLIPLSTAVISRSAVVLPRCIEVLSGVFDAHAQDTLPSRIISKKDQAEMILIPEGPFVFGMNQNEVAAIVVKKLKEPMVDFYKTELPKQKKTLGNFYMDRFEVTNEQYERFMKDTRHREPKYWKWPQFQGKRQPVVGVGWADAEAYARWAGKRLPTEEEWEKAARGNDGRIWPWGNIADDAKYNGRSQANFGPVKVGGFPSGDSPYGLSDVAGNVWEMTSSAWQGASKAMKGGAFLNTNADVRATVRWSAKDEKEGSTWLGFRCVMEAGNVRQFARPK